ncbi:MAG: HNH endonuclease signature motif containing protein [Amaricoccus sp.]
MRKIARQRAQMMRAQSGACYYCGQQTWLGDPAAFAGRHGISVKRSAAFQCTAEHLVPRSEGGPDAPDNIVAACRFCNQTRHRARQPLPPTAFKAKVARRLAAGRWQRLPRRSTSGEP